MTEPALTVRPVSADEAADLIGPLADILTDCVDGGASVSFLAPLARGAAERFWRGVIDGVASGDRVLLVAEDPTTARVVGTVQVVVGQPENQPHRGDVSKMLVHSGARRRGVGAALMQAAEQAARRAGKTLLVLDTSTGSDAERLYERLGWTRVGEVPSFALTPDGRPWATTIFYKRLSEQPPTGRATA
jgi:GNAT superfamily N-acetyltransferase